MFLFKSGWCDHYLCVVAVQCTSTCTFQFVDLHVRTTAGSAPGTTMLRFRQPRLYGIVTSSQQKYPLACSFRLNQKAQVVVTNFRTIDERLRLCLAVSLSADPSLRCLERGTSFIAMSFSVPEFVQAAGTTGSPTKCYSCSAVWRYFVRNVANSKVTCVFCDATLVHTYSWPAQSTNSICSCVLSKTNEVRVDEFVH